MPKNYEKPEEHFPVSNPSEILEERIKREELEAEIVKLKAELEAKKGLQTQIEKVTM